MSRDNVLAIDAILADGTKARFAEVASDLRGVNETDEVQELFRDLLALGERESEEIKERFPQVLRRVGGYNVDALLPAASGNNLSHLLVGSEGTLAFSEKITLKLSPILRNKVLGVCHFPQLPPSYGCHPASRQTRPYGRRTRRPQYDRAGSRHRHVPAYR